MHNYKDYQQLFNGSAFTRSTQITGKVNSKVTSSPQFSGSPYLPKPMSENLGSMPLNVELKTLNQDVFERSA